MFSSNPFVFNNNNQMGFDQSAFEINPNNQNIIQLLNFPSPAPTTFLDHTGDEGFLMNQLFSHLQQEEEQTNMGSGNCQARERHSPDKNMLITRAAAVATATIKKIGVTTPRKRKGKKDRHSKIYTAQGPRDRRMRLSLQVARKFFDLQDMLGFDKASKTVEWLFSKSVSAIKELTDKFPADVENKPNCSVLGGGVDDYCGGRKSTMANSTSEESEVVSEIKEIEDNMAIDHGIFVGESKKGLKSRKNFQVYDSPIAKESRDKARERARKRTKEKLILSKSDEGSYEANPNEIGEDFAQELNSNSIHHEEEEHKSKFFSIRKPLPRSASGLGFGNSSIKVGDSISEEIMIKDPVFAGNWEINNDRDQLDQVKYRSQCAMTNNMKIFSGNINIQAQNPNAIFMTCQQSPSPCFIISSSNPNPNSTLMDNKNSVHHHHQQQNPNPINVGLQSNFLGDLFEPGNSTSAAGYKFKSLFGDHSLY